MPCILCGGDAHDTVSSRDRRGKPLTTKLCLGCGLVFNDPIPGDEALRGFYAERYRLDYKGSARPRPRQILRNFRRAERFLKRHAERFAGTRLLDVGAGSGEFLFLARRLGCTVRGIEPSRAYAAHCREELGLDVTTADIEPGRFPAASFERIRLHHVLEHLNDPVRGLAILAEWLTADGLLHVEVPDIEGYARLKSRGNLFHYGHIFNFNLHTLRAAAGLAGLAEHGAGARSHAQAVGGFFARGAAWERARVRCPDNAAGVKAALAGHYAGTLGSRPRTAWPARCLSRMEESWSAWRLGGAREIGEHIAARSAGSR